MSKCCMKMTPKGLDDYVHKMKFWASRAVAARSELTRVVSISRARRRA